MSIGPSVSAWLLCIVTWKHGCPCVALCLCPSHLISVPTPCLECVHVYMSAWFSMSAPPLCIVIWKHGFLCVALFVCCSHSIPGPSPRLEGVYESVHVFMSTWLPISPQSPMHSYMETWVPLCGTVFVSQSPHFCSPPWLECVHASVHIDMSTWAAMTALALCIVTCKHGWHCVFFPISSLLVPLLL